MTYIAVWQALRAVELYVKVFVSSPASEPLKSDGQEKAITDAERVYEQMRDLIRVRHYSYRTEQTYLDWVRRYLGYALNHDLDWKNSESAGDRLLLHLAYGAGLRVSELICLRIKDLDFDNLLVVVRAAKGNKDRGTLLPRKLVEPLKAQIADVKRLHEQDLAAGHGAVYLPFALDRKYPFAPKEFGWQYMFYTHVIRGMDSTAESPLDEL